MNTEIRIQDSNRLKCLSVLLQFPDMELIESVKGARRQLQELVDGRGQPIGPFFDYLIQTPLLELQEQYSSTFDLNPAHSLNLTYHLWGDNKERGMAMARFAGTYADAGYAPATGELPDFLPLVLEFLAVAENGDSEWIRKDYAETIGILEKRLTKANSPYAAIFSSLAGTFGVKAAESSAADRNV